MENRDWLPFGLLGRPHGVRGESTLKPFNPDSVFSDQAQLPLAVKLVDHVGGREATLVSLRPAGDRYLVRLDGIQSRDQAATLTGSELHVSRDALEVLDPGEFFVGDLVGCQTHDTGGVLRGTVRGVFWNGAQDVLTIVNDAGDELMIPAVPEFLREVDLEARRIVVDTHE